jgi:hypothetical protein
MESNQLEFDFEAYAHKENNKESQAHFNNNKILFSKQCGLVYNLLMNGEVLTTRKALIDHNIGDLRRRVKDLIDIYKIPVQSRYVEGKFKEYYL